MISAAVIGVLFLASLIGGLAQPSLADAARAACAERGRDPAELVLQKFHERGRLFGHIAPLDMPLRVGGQLNPKAAALCDAAFERRLII